MTILSEPEVRPHAACGAAVLSRFRRSFDDENFLSRRLLTRTLPFAQAAIGYRQRNDGFDLLSNNALRPLESHWQLVPIFPAAFGNLCPNATVFEAAPFHGVAVADGISNVSVHMQGKSLQVWQRVNASPVHALLFGIGKHAVGGLVRAIVGSILVGYFSVGADRVQNALSAAGPGKSFCASDAVAYYGFGGDILFVTAGAAGGIVCRVLPAFARQQAGSCFIAVE
ncbi:MAG: hypothetical protein PUD50_10135 [Eubacteriales bacterium]|nr:hypothetical protein [Eubacteriales bacterium]